MNHYEDKRILKSRQKIIASFLKLLQERPFEEISIATICQKAQISRTTFYSHFADKQAVIHYFQEQVSREILTSLQKPSTDIDEFFVQVVTVWDKHYDALKLFLAPKNQALADLSLQELLEERFKMKILPFLALEGTSLEDRDYLATFYAGASSAVLRKWLTDDVRLSPEQLLEKFLLFLPKEYRKDTGNQVQFK